MTPDVHVHRVERDAILELRAEVLSVDGTRIAALTGDLSPNARHWVASIDGVAVGCATVMAVRGQVLRGMGVRASHRRMGVGTALLAAIHTQVAGPMWCNARVAAVPFYRRNGWDTTGPRFDRPVVGATQRMVWRPRAVPRTTEVCPDPPIV